MTAVLEIRLFGGLQIRQNNTPITGFISSKVPALLAYLAITGHSHQRDALAALLWGEIPEADAKNNLRQALANLRKLAKPYLVITRDTAAFNSEVPHLLDTLVFEQQLKISRQQNGDGRFAAIQEAAALYQGEFLAGFFVRDAPDFEEWMLAQRLRYRELALHMLHNLTQHHLERGEYGRAIDSATRLLALDAWREEAHRQLMMAQMRTGQRSASLAQYQTCYRMLDKELGVKPSTETTILFERIRDARHQVQIPPSHTPFVGRSDELAYIARLIAEPTCHLLTISGPGGSGKTRLAIEAAARAAQTYLHGVFFVQLAPIQDTELVPSSIAEVLGLTLSGITSPIEQLKVYLRDKDLMLVLDNMEHLPNADVLVSRLVESCPDIFLLVTSRERLNLHGERLLELNGLDVPQITADEAITEFSAAKLFFLSALETKPSFALDLQTEAAVVQICHLVDGLPLAIELAAAWVRHLSCEEIANEIEQNLSFLATTQKNVPERHRSLQAAFEHSWALLGEDERDTFARMAVFRGGCDREAATAVTRCKLSVLANLCDKSLLRRDANGRYVIHELLRQFAAQKLQTEILDSFRTEEEHCRYYVSFVSNREDTLYDARQNDTRQEMTKEIDNIRAAWEWAISHHGLYLLEPAFEGLRVYLEHTGRFTEAVTLFESAAAEARAGGRTDSLLLAKLLARQGWFLCRLDQFPAARELVQESLGIFQQAAVTMPDEEALCFLCLGNIARVVGDFEESKIYSRQSLALHRASGNPYLIATSLNTLAVAHAELCEFDKASQFHEEGLIFRRKTGDRRGIATTLVNLGFVAIGRGKYEDVEQFAHEALIIFREIGYPLGEAVAMNNLAVAHYWLKKYEQARSLLQECLIVCQELGHRHLAAFALGTLGGVASALGEYSEAWRLISEALLLSGKIGSVSATLGGLMNSAFLLDRLGNHEKAAEVAALVYHHESANREAKDRIKNLLTELELKLPAAVFSVTQAQGKTKTLENAVDEILEQCLPLPSIDRS